MRQSGFPAVYMQYTEFARFGQYLPAICSNSLYIFRMAGGDPVHIFSYLDYRHFLRDLYAQKKASERGFSHRAFSKRAGLSSTNYLHLVMQGKRNLSPEMAASFARGCGLAWRAAALIRTVRCPARSLVRKGHADWRKLGELA